MTEAQKTTLRELLDAEIKHWETTMEIVANGNALTGKRDAAFFPASFKERLDLYRRLIDIRAEVIRS